jgi:2'-5' RNA ligase
VRCFVAVGGGAGLAAALGDWLTLTRERFPELSVTAPANLHLTLAFLGELDEAAVAAAASAVDGAAAGIVRGWEVGWGEAGGFPGGSRPRVLWLGVGTGAAELMAAQRLLAGELGARGLPLDAKPYRPHLTLARVRNPPLARGRGAELQAWLAQMPVPGPMAVDSIVLYRSTLGRPAAIHTPIRTARLE